MSVFHRSGRPCQNNIPEFVCQFSLLQQNSIPVFFDGVCRLFSQVIFGKSEPRKSRSAPGKEQHEPLFLLKSFRCVSCKFKTLILHDSHFQLGITDLKNQ